MIIAIVRFPLDPPMSYEAASDSFESSAPSYQSVPGLHRKHFLRGEDGGMGGGAYLWADKASAEAFYDDAWHERLTTKFGARPQIEYFDCPVVVDPDEIIVG